MGDVQSCWWFDPFSKNALFHSNLHIAKSQTLSFFLLLCELKNVYICVLLMSSNQSFHSEGALWTQSDLVLSFTIACYETWGFLWTEWENDSTESFCLISWSCTHSGLSKFHEKCQPYNHRGVRTSKKKENYIKNYPPLSTLIYPPRSCLVEHFQGIFEES